jgi:hypothetical protein
MAPPTGSAVHRAASANVLNRLIMPFSPGPYSIQRRNAALPPEFQPGQRADFRGFLRVSGVAISPDNPSFAGLMDANGSRGRLKQGTPLELQIGHKTMPPAPARADAGGIGYSKRRLELADQHRLVGIFSRE